MRCSPGLAVPMRNKFLGPLKRIVLSPWPRFRQGLAVFAVQMISQCRMEFKPSRMKLSEDESFELIGFLSNRFRQSQSEYVQWWQHEKEGWFPPRYSWPVLYCVWTIGILLCPIVFHVQKITSESHNIVWKMTRVVFSSNSTILHSCVTLGPKSRRYRVYSDHNVFSSRGPERFSTLEHICLTPRRYSFSASKIEQRHGSHWHLQAWLNFLWPVSERNSWELSSLTYSTITRLSEVLYHNDRKLQVPPKQRWLS